MALKENDSFPWSLEQAAKEGLGSAAWTKEDGSRVWIERNEAGFEAAAFWGGDRVLGATWKWEGAPGGSACVLSEISGLHADAMETAGLSTTDKNERILEIMGAMAMGPGTYARSDWEEWKAVKEAGLGFSEKQGRAWKRRSGPVAAPNGAGVAAKRGLHGR